MSGTYRLTPPNPQAFDAGADEVALLQQLTRPGGEALVGYLAAAQLGRLNSGEAYQGMLARVNQQQMQEGAAQRALELQVADNKLAGDLAPHPGSIMLTTPGQRITAPSAMPLASQYSLAGLAGVQAQTAQRQGEGARSFAGAGLDPAGQPLSPEAVLRVPEVAGRALTAGATERAAQTSAAGRENAARISAQGNAWRQEQGQARINLATQRLQHDQIMAEIRASGTNVLNAQNQVIQRTQFETQYRDIARRRGLGDVGPPAEVMGTPAASAPTTQGADLRTRVQAATVDRRPGTQVFRDPATGRVTYTGSDGTQRTVVVQ